MKNYQEIYPDIPFADCLTGTDISIVNTIIEDGGHNFPDESDEEVRRIFLTNLAAKNHFRIATQPKKTRTFGEKCKVYSRW